MNSAARQEQAKPISMGRELSKDSIQRRTKTAAGNAAGSKMRAFTVQLKRSAKIITPATHSPRSRVSASLLAATAAHAKAATATPPKTMTAQSHPAAGGEINRTAPMTASTAESQRAGSRAISGKAKTGQSRQPPRNAVVAPICEMKSRWVAAAKPADAKGWNRPQWETLYQPHKITTSSGIKKPAIGKLKRLVLSHQ